jgi:hypothetical protein
MDLSPRPGLYTFHTKLAELDVKAPVFEVDARSRDDIKLMLQALLSVLDPSLQR